jgi:hypothetical protein
MLEGGIGAMTLRPRPERRQGRNRRNRRARPDRKDQEKHEILIPKHETSTKH